MKSFDLIRRGAIVGILSFSSLAYAGGHGIGLGAGGDMRGAGSFNSVGMMGARVGLGGDHGVSVNAAGQADVRGRAAANVAPDRRDIGLPATEAAFQHAASVATSGRGDIASAGRSDAAITHADRSDSAMTTAGTVRHRTSKQKFVGSVHHHLAARTGTNEDLNLH